jgi:hypothetical protein
MRRLRSLRDSDDEGQIALLVLVYTLICLSFVAVAVNATAVHLARTQLLDAADAAALDAADAIDERSVYGRGVGSGDSLPVTSSAVRDQATQYLAEYDPPSRIDSVIVAGGTGTDDGASATVVLSGVVRLPVAGSVVAAWNGGIRVTVGSTARSALLP